jgi:hypothetical protein
MFDILKNFLTKFVGMDKIIVTAVCNYTFDASFQMIMKIIRPASC